MAKKMLAFGPPLGVRSTKEPYDDAALGDYAQDALNCVFRDPSLLSGATQRQGGTATGTGATWTTIQATQALALHTNEQTALTFLIANGKLYRLNSANWDSAPTDVSPVGISIPSSGNPIGIVDVGSSIVVSDGVNRPWVGTNLSATPITGAYIDIDGAGGSWSAGWPTVYQGSVLFPTITVPGGSAVTAGVGVVWSEPAQPTVGYTQTGYADFFNIIEHDASQVFAVWGTNIGVFYFRQSSVGFISGPLASFTTTATMDARSTVVGAVTAAGIQQFLDNIFFTDAAGRPWMMPLTGSPQPIWKQMAAFVDDGAYNPFGSSFRSNIQKFTASSIVPDLDLYAFVSWTPQPVGNWPTVMFVFDARSGNFCGRWQWYSQDGINVMGRITKGAGSTAPGTVYFATLGGIKDSTYSFAAAGSRLMVLSRPDDINPVDGQFGTSAFGIAVSVTTGRLGYSADSLVFVDSADVITTGTTSSGNLPITVGAITPYVQSTNPSAQATAVTPPVVFDSVFRTHIGCSIGAVRYVQFVVSLAATFTAPYPSEMWGFQRISAPAVTSKAGPEDV